MEEFKEGQAIVLEHSNPEGADEKEHKPSYDRSKGSLVDLLLHTLQAQGYEFLKIDDKNELIDNLRKQLEKLNAQTVSDFAFTDSEWNNFYNQQFNEDHSIESINNLMHLDCAAELKRDNGAKYRISLFDKHNPQNNHLQIIKHSPKQGKNSVAILINGLPIVQIHFTEGEVTMETALQTLDYDEELNPFRFTQIFILSNGLDTKYFSNSIKSHKPEEKIQMAESWGYSNSPKPIGEIVQFATTFLSPNVLINILFKYCILDSEGHLKILRPYQIAAIERILHKIQSSINAPSETQGTDGYIWHANGTGKTLTSLKVTQLAFDIPEVKKVILLSDKKCLDDQIYSAYKRFLDESINLKDLKKIINDEKRRIIVTNTQKLRRLLGEDDAINSEIKNERVVIISDECHRNHTEIFRTLINKHFSVKNWFGFTGTPLITQMEDGKLHNHTTEIFENLLHEYTWIDAITGKIALPIRVQHNYDQYSRNSSRISEVVSYVLESFDEISNNRKFNALFTVESTAAATKYYKEFQKQQLESESPLKIVMIFNPPTQKEYAKWSWDSDEAMAEESFRQSMDDYNKLFNANVKDFFEFEDAILQGLKNKEIDILIVVNMFLEGLNAPTLNTVYIDKNLSKHNLIQTLSRINRVLNREKQVGNVILFRDIQKQLDEALLLFSIDERSVQTVSLAEEN